MQNLQQLIDAVRAERELDPRTTVFDIRVEPRTDSLVLVGETTDPDAVQDLLLRAPEATGGIRLDDRVVRLPAFQPGDRSRAAVRASVACVHAEPRVSAPLVSQYVLGHGLDLLSRTDDWLRVRGDDGYIGWVHRGTLHLGADGPTLDWDDPGDGDPVVSLGADLVDEDGWALTRLPWGARAIRESGGRIRLPDGRRATVHAGELVDADRLPDRFPPRGESVVRSARRWGGTPYIWGGVTPMGADCSGFVQAVFRMHGIELPRDSDQQAGAGSPLGGVEALAELRPGDLLFFEDAPGQVSHVAISLGDQRIIHSALVNGGVGINDLGEDRADDRKLLSTFAAARRVLPA